MSGDFVILHLSDAHIGHPSHSTNSRSVLAPLIQDIKFVRTSKALVPSLIVFNGDLAFGHISTSPLVDQYKQAKQFLADVYGALDSAPDRVPLLIVPGNHDIDRNRIGDGERLWATSLNADSAYKAMKENGTTWRRMLERQEVYWQFVTDMTGSSDEWNLDQRFYSITGQLKHGNMTIGLAGLNSCWASSKADEQGQLWLGRLQVEEVLERIGEVDFRIAVAHHPVSWLNQSDFEFVRDRIDTTFNIFMHGHQHSSWFNDSDKHLTLSAGACYQGATKPNGYCWLMIDFEQRSSKLLLRQYSDRGSGGWMPLEIPGKDVDGDGYYPIKHLFGQSQPQGVAIAPAIPARPVDLPGCNLTSKRCEVCNVLDCITILETDFSFRWEPSPMQTDSPGLCVYWPVRLRSPTPIHAVQCFAAALMSQFGAEVTLCIDDLGSREYSSEHFIDRIRAWFSRVRGIESRLSARTFSEVLGDGQSGVAWQRVQEWLGSTDYRLGKVLTVSKLLDDTTTLGELVQKRPRRLLTPALVWSCLARVAPAQGSVVTLGGFDEQPLWHSWRECITAPGLNVSHLYNAELKVDTATSLSRPVYMRTDNLAWKSRQDIEQTLKTHILSLSDSTAWQQPTRIVSWCLNGSILLPDFVASDHASLWQAQFADDVAPVSLISGLVDGLDKWLLRSN